MALRNIFLLVFLLWNVAWIHGQKQLDVILRSYDKTVSPAAGGDSPMVQISAYINNVHYNGDERVLGLGMYLREQWVDSRLSFIPEENPTERINLHPSNSERIWIPDIFFRQAMSVEAFNVPTPQVLTRINTTGGVYRVQNLGLDIPCEELGGLVPMISCDLYFESFGYTADDVALTWLGETKVQIGDDVKPTGNPEVVYLQENSKMADCTQSYTAGTFSCLAAILRFRVLDG